MKANELRIGNWVLFGEKGEPFKVESDDISKTAYGSFDYYPIPLTEEWLVKFGASCDVVSGESVYYLTIVDSKFYFVFSDDEYYLVDSNGKMLISFGSEYAVHQLQNLYFSLTGKEIELKP